uniref:Uncharacterized protein n=1 Tax=Salix viminalis TaxID=40686 RepID=A0A6N2LYM6_SALVM
MKIEKVKFCKEICNIIAYEGCNRTERHERVDRWRRQLSRAGFQVMGLKCMSQAREMLSVYGIDGYTLATEKGLSPPWMERPAYHAGICMASAQPFFLLMPAKVLLLYIDNKVDLLL